jgi:hypothetical protein
MAESNATLGAGTKNSGVEFRARFQGSPEEFLFTIPVLSLCRFAPFLSTTRELRGRMCGSRQQPDSQAAVHFIRNALSPDQPLRLTTRL